MYINEVCSITGLTKKAIEYYEKQGLLQPEKMENGYRAYHEKELFILKEISLLRKIGIGIQDIKVILGSADKQAALLVCKNKMTRQKNLLTIQYRCMNELIEHNCNASSLFEDITRKLDENYMIRERLAEAFPGSYGQFLSFHFGRFLNEKTDTPEKEAAFGKILEFLDSIEEMTFPDELTSYFSNENGLWNEEVMKSIEAGSKAAIENPDSFMEEKRNIIELYLAYCKTDAYKTSPAYKIKAFMLEFQKTSGYLDIFIKNMKILSREYAEYYEKLIESNSAFLREYPDAAGILGYM